jgi:hypothetical protein
MIGKARNYEEKAKGIFPLITRVVQSCGLFGVLSVE